MQETIASLTLNPTIDTSYVVERMAHTHKMRAQAEHYDPGGGGINVARVLVRLGAAVRCHYLSGGATGAAAGAGATSLRGARYARDVSAFAASRALSAAPNPADILSASRNESCPRGVPLKLSPRLSAPTLTVLVCVAALQA